MSLGPKYDEARLEIELLVSFVEKCKACREPCQRTEMQNAWLCKRCVPLLKSCDCGARQFNSAKVGSIDVARCAKCGLASGAYFRVLRAKLGLTQTQFRERLGVSLRTVKYWESKGHHFAPSA